MKKISILLMLCFVFSFGALASNGITKEKKNQIEKNEKIFDGLCLGALPFWVSCPDGGEFLGGVDVFLFDCSTGEIQGFMTILSDWGPNPCDEEVWIP